MKYTVLTQQLVDALLARAALCGDITRRGSILNDNDCLAIVEILKIAVPAALDEFEIPFHPLDKGWRIGPTSVPKAVLLRFLVGNLLFRITGDDSLIEISFSNPDVDIPPLIPHW